MNSSPPSSSSLISPHSECTTASAHPPMLACSNTWYICNLARLESSPVIQLFTHSDKAGGYGVNGPGGALIPRIDGDFYCVMGLPLHRLCCELNKLFLDDL